MQQVTASIPGDQDIGSHASGDDGWLTARAVHRGSFVPLHRQIHDVVSDYSFIELPVLIEIIDAPERVRAFVSALGTVLTTRHNFSLCIFKALASWIG